MADSISEVAGCGRSAAGKEGDPGHHPAPSGASRVALTGLETLWPAALWAPRHRQDTAGQSCGHWVLYDLPQVGLFLLSVYVLDYSVSLSVAVHITMISGASWCPLTQIAFDSSVKGPELINMYVGQSEENIREGKNQLKILSDYLS